MRYINVQQKNRWTALMYAAQNGHAAVVEWLLKAGLTPFLQAASLAGKFYKDWCGKMHFKMRDMDATLAAAARASAARGDRVRSVPPARAAAADAVAAVAATRHGALLGENCSGADALYHGSEPTAELELAASRVSAILFKEQLRNEEATLEVLGALGWANGTGMMQFERGADAMREHNLAACNITQDKSEGQVKHLKNVNDDLQEEIEKLKANLKIYRRWSMS